MLRPYKVIKETNEESIYEFRTVFLWLLCAIVALILVGFLLSIEPMWIIGFVALLLYCVLVITPCIKIDGRSKNAMKTGEIRLSGSLWSFRHPYRVTIPNRNTKQRAGADRDPAP
jgi:hypothetical protein